jgi:hypothetical protein
MIASGAALILIPIAAFARPRRGIHRALGRMAAVAVVIGGLTALPVALASEATATARAGLFTQGLVWLALLAFAVSAIRRGDVARHARFMLAMAAVASGAIWLRLVTFAAISVGVPFEQVYAGAAWTCWLVPLGVAAIAASWFEPGQRCRRDPRFERALRAGAAKAAGRPPFRIRVRRTYRCRRLLPVARLLLLGLGLLLGFEILAGRLVDDLHGEADSTRSSKPSAFAFTLSPSLTTSVTFCTRRGASWLMHEAVLGPEEFTKAPKSITLTTVPCRLIWS